MMLAGLVIKKSYTFDIVELLFCIIQQLVRQLFFFIFIQGDDDQCCDQLVCSGGAVDENFTREQVSLWHQAFAEVYKRVLCNFNLYDFWTSVVCTTLEKEVKFYIYEYIHRSRRDCSSCRRHVDCGECLCPLCLESLVPELICFFRI